MHKCSWLFCALLSILYWLPLPIYADSQQALLAIHQSINQQKKQLAEQRKNRQHLQFELQRQETAIAQLLEVIQQIKTKLTQLNRDIARLNHQIDRLEQNYIEQQKRLSVQLESAFKLGKNSGFERLFNDTESQQNERIMAYFGYINQWRQWQIHQLKLTQQALIKSKMVLETKRSAQQHLQSKQKKEHSRLDQQRQARKTTLVALDTSLHAGEVKLAQLYENEAKLQKKLLQAAKLSQATSDREAREAAQIRSRQKRSNYRPTLAEKALMSRVSGIGTPQNQLDWPLLGKVSRHFGEPIQGQLYWKGLVISSQEGSTVRAIAGGRVILASWLQGYGFMVAIDHGKGDMSLYGYNQRVLVNVEDNVKKGQPIALVGSSGGQGESGLYFEIRRDGKPFDPRVWLTR